MQDRRIFNMNRTSDTLRKGEGKASVDRCRVPFAGFMVIAVVVACDAGPAALEQGQVAVPLVPAFPGAEGWGAAALNECRSLPLALHVVSTTEDSGDGSFRSILENQVRDDRYDVVVFSTGGTIASRGQLSVSVGCVYIAGQTAPGDGILIRSHPTSGHDGFLIRVLARENIVVRHLRLRHGHEGGYGGGGIGIIGEGGGRHVVFDHISVTWGGDNSHIQVSRSLDGPNTEQISLQNNLIAEGIHNRAAMISGGDEHGRIGRISYHRNLTSTVGQRHPRIAAGDARRSTDYGVEVVNNVMYNAHNRFTEAAWRSVVDFVGNYQDPGPDFSFSRGGMNRWDGEGDGPLDPSDPGSLYLAGNVHTDFSGPEVETWRDSAEESKVIPLTFRRSSRMSLPPFPVQERSASSAREWVLDNAGASGKVTCDGRWVFNRDSVDQRIVDAVRSRASVGVAFQKLVQELNGGWPTMDPGAACNDSDGDGLPDAWEQRFFGCATCADPKERTASGYLVIEHYVNGTLPR
jgi:pectate lyase